MSKPESSMSPAVSAAWLAEQISEASAAGIASTMTRLIRRGDIAAGSALPTVRALSARLHVSPATTSAAWSMLRKQRMVEGHGRQGTWVLDGSRALAPERYENVTKLWQNGVHDLSLASPDPALLPDLVTALTNAHIGAEINSYRRPNITPALQEAVAPTWPWEAEHWLAVNGGYEGLHLLFRSGLVPGDYVAVADPSAPRILDLLELVGARILPVKTDEEGPTYDSLEKALQSQPVAFLYEPRTSSRLGISLSATRRDRLASLIGTSQMLIIEDDGLGILASTDYAGLGELFPTQTVMVRSFSKSHGPDLRLAVMGGAYDPIHRAQMYLQFGAGWASRFMQDALAWMLTDHKTQMQIEHAREVYRARRNQISNLLSIRGIDLKERDGLTVPVPVLNERQALLVLASHGIAADAGRASALRKPLHIVRLGIGHELPNPERIADAYSLAAQAI